MTDPLNERLAQLEAQLEMAHEQLAAQQLVLAWLLAQHPPEVALRFLGSQANELEGNLKFVEHVALLDALTEDAREFHALRKSAQDGHK